jgi:hypothetical protein
MEAGPKGIGQGVVVLMTGVVAGCGRDGGVIQFSSYVAFSLWQSLGWAASRRQFRRAGGSRGQRKPGELKS